MVQPRWKPDERLPLDEQVPRTPTVKALLHGQRAILQAIDATQVAAGKVILELALIAGQPERAGWVRVLRASNRARDEARYTLDENPNDTTGRALPRRDRAARCVGRRAQGGYHTLYEFLTAARSRQLRGQTSHHGTRAVSCGAMRVTRSRRGKQAFIGGHGETPVLLVQGPPGTGKSFSTAYALFARLQGAMAAGRSCRIFVSCHSHAAIDVLMAKVRAVQVALAA